MKNEIFETNPGIISKMKLDNNIQISEKDTFYVFSQDFVSSITDISKSENENAMKIMSLFESSPDDDENVCILGSTMDIYHFLIHLQRHLTP
jgi:hypothetical protein